MLEQLNKSINEDYKRTQQGVLLDLPTTYTYCTIHDLCTTFLYLF